MNVVLPHEHAAAAQREASDPHVSAFVSANAGSGKTKLLIDRLLRLMLAGVDPGRIQCLTFTKAAAAEMASRLQRRLGTWVALDDASLDEAIGELAMVPTETRRDLARALFARVLDLPGGMRISTIHAFCQSLLRRFPLEASLSPHFALLEDEEAQAALVAAREDALRRVEPAHADILSALVTQDQLDGLLKALRARVETLRPLLALPHEERLALFRRAGGVVETSDAAVLAHGVAWVGETALREALGAFRATASAATARNAEAMLDWLARDAQARAASWDEWAGCFYTKAKPRKVGGFCGSKPFLNANPVLCEAWETEQARVGLVEESRRALRMAEASAALVAFAEPVLEHYEKHKEHGGLLEYDELIRRTTTLLHDPGVAWVLYKLDGGLDHLLLDEVQDTAPSQWEIAGRLTEPFFQGLGREPFVRGGDREGEPARSVFAVGDRKQSIFSFQGADPREFDNWRARLGKAAENAGGAWREPKLAVSFRSTTPVLRLVDAIFQNDALAMQGVRDGGVVTRHIASREGMAGAVVLWPLAPLPARDEAETPWKTPRQGRKLVSAEQRLADAIATDIRRQLDDGEMLESRGRAVRAGDFLVLVRRRTGFGRALVSALKRLDVPVAGLDRMVLTEQPAVADLLALGDALLLPEDDLAVATVLTSPLGGLDDDSLMALAMERRGRLIHALRRRAGERADWGRAWTFLSALLDRVDFATPHGLLVEALGSLGGRARLLARLGPEASEPIDELLSLALSYGRTRPASMQGFLHWLRQSGAQVKREGEGAGGAVRIMTVHSAKGLQAPIVIVPDTTSMPPEERGLAWAADPASRLTLPLWAPNGAFGCEAVLVAAKEQRRAAIEEYNRLLYVALTRAEDCLIVCGWEGRKIDDASWYRAVERGMAEIAAVAVDFGPWQGPCLMLEAAQLKPAVLKPEHAAAFGVATPPSWAGAAPDWRASAPAAEPMRPLPLAPSRPDWAGAGAVPASFSPLPREARAAAFRRGDFVHRLLQHLPGLPSGERAAAVARATTLAPDLEPALAESLAREALAVMEQPDLAPLFGPEGRSEQALTGYVGGLVVTGQVDRLAVLADEVIVADYKTAREPPERAEATPPLYLRQMAAYRAVLRGIYPDRPVRCVLVWTVGPLAVDLPDALLDGHAPGAWPLDGEAVMPHFQGRDESDDDERKQGEL